jgi:hypothetical protein
VKRLLLFSIILITLANVSYASFPITESNTEILKTIISEDTEEDEPSLLVYILRGVLAVSILGFGLYFLVRTIWRAYRRDVLWVKKLLRWKNIWWLLLLIPVWFILNLLGSGGVGG